MFQYKLRFIEYIQEITVIIHLLQNKNILIFIFLQVRLFMHFFKEISMRYCILIFMNSLNPKIVNNFKGISFCVTGAHNQAN